MLIANLYEIGEEIENPGRILSMHPLFPAAFRWIFEVFEKADKTAENAPISEEEGNPKVSSITPGVYPLENGMRGIIDEYYPKPLRTGKFENHRKFIDIQLLLEGEEWLFWRHSGNHSEDELLRTSAYNDEKDIEFFSVGEADPLVHFTRVVLKGKGLLAPKTGDIPVVILWPGDWHMPCIFPDPRQDEEKEYARIRKIVIKVPIV